MKSLLLSDLSIYRLTASERALLAVLSRSSLPVSPWASSCLTECHGVGVPLPGLQAPELRLPPHVARTGTVGASVTKGSGEGLLKPEMAEIRP